MNSTPSAPLLSVAKLNAGYGSKQILFDVDLEVGRGDIVVVVGPNGAGKTTLLSAISGLCRILGGTIAYAGGDIAGCALIGSRGRAWPIVRKAVTSFSG